MSSENVQEIITKAVTDEEYRDLLLSDPEKALEGYELTDEETASLKALERDEFEAAAGELDERVSRAAYIKFGEFRLDLGPGEKGIIIIGSKGSG
jgi:hypothetical protein